MQPTGTLPRPQTGVLGFGGRITLCTLFGIRIQLDWSWILLGVLVTWTLATGFFPPRHPGLAPATYWWMGVLGSLGLVVSLLAHELSHCLVARRFRIPIRGITLFIFGGVAELGEEPPSAKAEFLMAAAGPAMSLALGVVLDQVATGIGPSDALEPARGVVEYLSLINIMLGVFNLVPAFPLDGGRMLRALLWWLRGDLHAATRRAAMTGGMFGALLIALGLFLIVTGQVIGGIWWFVIGLFVRNAAHGSYMQMIARETLAGIPIGRFMTLDPVAVPPSISIRRFVDDYVYRLHFDMFPVVERGTLLGWIGTRQVKRAAHEDWDRVTVGGLLEPLSDDNCVDAGLDAARALTLMSRTANHRLLVTERGRLVGVVTLADLVRSLSLRLELEPGR